MKKANKIKNFPSILLGITFLEFVSTDNYLIIEMLFVSQNIFVEKVTKKIYDLD